jgi:hypothetical protein
VQTTPANLCIGTRGVYFKEVEINLGRRRLREGLVLHEREALIAFATHARVVEDVTQPTGCAGNRLAFKKPAEIPR